MNKKTLITLISVVLVLALAIGGTFAYLYGESDVVKNHFNANKVTVELTETKTPADTEGVHNYEIVPGTSAEKDPTVTVENTVDAYAFVKITDELGGKATYSIAGGWLPLTGVEGVYYREVAAQGADETKSFPVLAGNTVYYSSTLTNDQVAGGGDLSFKAYAIQKMPFNDPVSAWYAQNPETVSELSTLDSALRAGKSVKLDQDLSYSGTLYVPAGKTVQIDLNGHKLTSVDNSGLYVYGNVTIVDSSADKSGGIQAQEMTVVAWDGATVTIESGTFTAIDNAVVGTNGSRGRGGNTITINGGTFTGGITSPGYVACGIYAPNDDTWTINGGTFNITGGAGIVARAGVVTVNGGTFNCTGDVTGKVGDSRVVVPCSALVFDAQAGYPALNAESKIIVNGGTFAAEDDAGVFYQLPDGTTGRIIDNR